MWEEESLCLGAPKWEGGVGEEESREGGWDLYHSKGYLKAERGAELAMPVLTNKEEKVSHSQPTTRGLPLHGAGQLSWFGCTV